MQYWVIVGNERRGPMPMDELIGAGVTATTYVWRKGLKNWMQASQVEELNGIVTLPVAPTVSNSNDAERAEDEKRTEEIDKLLEQGYDESFDERNYDSSEGTSEDRRIEATGASVVSTEVETKQEQKLAQPSTYLAFSVFTTIFCCLPLGLLATIYSLKVEDYYEDGKLNRSYRASRNALWMNVVSLILTMTAYIILLTALLCILSLNGVFHSLLK